nr:lipocalin family protein [Aquimarina algicola]
MSCSTDDDSNPQGEEVLVVKEADLIGKWQLTEATENDSDEQLTECDLLDTREFKSGGELIVDSHFEIADTCDNTIRTIEWALSENVVTFNGSDKETVIELTSTTIKFQYTEKDGDDEFTYVETYKKL